MVSFLTYPYDCFKTLISPSLSQTSATKKHLKDEDNEEGMEKKRKTRVKE